MSVGEDGIMIYVSIIIDDVKKNLFHHDAA